MSAVPHIGRAADIDSPADAGADAASSLYERFSGQIYGYCLHQLGSREEAEDALQTTFMNAFRGLQRGIVPKIESAWLFKIAHNVCLSRRRSSWRRGRVEAPNNLEVLQEIVPARQADGDELIGLQDALDKMPDSQRRAILLREWQGLSYGEIAAEMELSQSAVETLIFRARRALAQGLQEEPVERRWRRRARHGLDGGAMLTALKGLLSGSTAVKVAATAAVVATTAVATSQTGGGQHSRVHRARPVARAVASTPGSTSAPTRASASAPLRAAAPTHRRAPMHPTNPVIARPAPSPAATGASSPAQVTPTPPEHVPTASTQTKEQPTTEHPGRTPETPASPPSEQRPPDEGSPSAEPQPLPPLGADQGAGRGAGKPAPKPPKDQPNGH